jgi:UDP-GlcNAc:undecaprenyl-phosphate GlcNAc-1-phosphate transferase
MVDIKTTTSAPFVDAVLDAIELRAPEFLLVLGGVVGGLLVLNAIAPGLNLLDYPDRARKRHSHPVPLTGGLAILIGVWLGSFVEVEPGLTKPGLLALLAIVGVVHAFDDQSALSARQRLVIDAVIALAVVVITGHSIETLGTVLGVELKLGLLAVPVTIFVYLALTNAYNMIDGLDGLAIIQFLIAFGGVAIWHVLFAHNTGFAPHAFSVAVASVVVLLANLGLLGPKLKCFLGDSGARLLGFFLVYVLVAEGNRILSPIEAVYFIALPLLDICAVVVARLRAGRGPMQADRRHLHYLLVDAGLTQGRAVLTMAAISCAFIGLYALEHIAGLGDFTIWLIFMGLATLYWCGRHSLVRVLAPQPDAQKVMGPAE